MRCGGWPFCHVYPSVVVRHLTFGISYHEWCTDPSPICNYDAETLKAFLEEYFDEAGSDLIPHTPADHVANPPDFLPRVQSVVARDWGLKVHSLWPSLTRQVSSAVEMEPDRHTLLPLKNPFLVPGERFREVYYWDSYWVIRSTFFPSFH